MENYKISCHLILFQVPVIWVALCFHGDLFSLTRDSKIKQNSKLWKSLTLTLLSHYWTCLRRRTSSAFHNFTAFLKQKPNLLIFSSFFRVTQWRDHGMRLDWLWTISRGNQIMAVWAEQGKSEGAMAMTIVLTWQEIKLRTTGKKMN